MAREDYEIEQERRMSKVQIDLSIQEMTMTALEKNNARLEAQVKEIATTVARTDAVVSKLDATLKYSIDAQIDLKVIEIKKDSDFKISEIKKDVDDLKKDSIASKARAALIQSIIGLCTGGLGASIAVWLLKHLGG